MKTKRIIKSTIAAIAILFLASCSDSVLDRPQLNDGDDATYWIDESSLRLYSNEFYTQFFVGYNSGWGTDYTPIRGLYFSDDVVSTNVQPLFETSVPGSRGSNENTDKAPGWLPQYSGPTWYFGWIRKSNVMLSRMETNMSSLLSDEAKNHWTSVARFFRALEYCRLVSVFGDVPYIDKELDIYDNEAMYKDRTPRNEVMDRIYDEFKYVLKNIRVSDGNQTLNKYVAAGFISRWMLFEGTWQKYHKADNARAKKFLEFAVEAAEVVMNSNKYKIDTDFRLLFGSEDLSLNKECILYRHYEASQGITHHIASYCNITEGQGYAANLALTKAFICNDGNVWQNAQNADAKKFDLENLVKTRDSRFEATFWDKPRSQASSLLYTVKFIDRKGPTFAGGAYPSKYGSYTNTNDAPVMRLGEVLLNWIEAKAELQTVGGTAVTQADIDKSINELRNRPLAAEAIDKGVVKTADLKLNNLPNDPARDPDISALIWEIRRERRMELYMEHSRLLDIKRWKKLDYMKGSTNPDLLKGIWVDIPKEIPTLVAAAKKNKTQVMKEDGTIVVFNGTNAADMVGYYLPEGVKDRTDFSDRSYLAPVGKNQIDLYKNKGYKLTQTPGWD